MNPKRSIYFYNFLGSYAIFLTLRILMNREETALWSIVYSLVMATAFVLAQYAYMKNKNKKES